MRSFRDHLTDDTIAVRNADVAQFIDFLAFGRHVVSHRRKIMAAEVREDQKLKYYCTEHFKCNTVKSCLLA